MNWRWYRDLLAQWQKNQRLRYAVLLVIVILSMHGILKIADSRDALVKDWTKDQDLLNRLREVASQPAWPERAEAAHAQLRAVLLALPLATTEGQARADQHMWLSDLARRGGVQSAQVTVEDALEVPEQPGLIQVVARLEAQDVPWKFSTPLRLLAQGLPWRQAQRLEIIAGAAGKMSLIVRSYYRDASIDIPPPQVVAVASTPGGALGSTAAPSPSLPAATRRSLPAPAPTTDGGSEADDERAGVVEGVLQSSGKPRTTERPR